MSELATQNELQQDRYVNFDIATDYFKGIGQPKYAKCAVMAENILNLFLSTENSGDNSPYTICLTLQPKVNAPSEKNSREAQAASDGFRIYYESELPQPTKDLMMLTEGLTQARLIEDTRGKDGLGMVINQAHQDGIGFYLVENYGKDSTGNFLTWSVNNRNPAEITEDEVPFFTTGQTEEAVLDFYKEFKFLEKGQIPNKEIEAADVIIDLVLQLTK